MLVLRRRKREREGNQPRIRISLSLSVSTTKKISKNVLFIKAFHLFKKNEHLNGLEKSEKTKKFIKKASFSGLNACSLNGKRPFGFLRFSNIRK